MNFDWKHKTAVLALSAAMLSVSAGAQVAPAAKPVKPPVEVVHPAPSVDVETGQLLDKGPRWPHKVERTSGTPPTVNDAAAPPSAEKGIKDPGVKSCGSCGLTGRQAAPPPVDCGAAPSAAKTGRPKERDDAPRNTSATQRPVRPGQGTCASYVRNKKNELVCSNKPPVDQTK